MITLYRALLKTSILNNEEIDETFKEISNEDSFITDYFPNAKSFKEIELYHYHVVKKGRRSFQRYGEEEIFFTFKYKGNPNYASLKIIRDDEDNNKPFYYHNWIMSYGKYISDIDSYGKTYLPGNEGYYTDIAKMKRREVSYNSRVVTDGNTFLGYYMTIDQIHNYVKRFEEIPFSNGNNDIIDKKVVFSSIFIEVNYPIDQINKDDKLIMSCGKPNMVFITKGKFGEYSIDLVDFKTERVITYPYEVFGCQNVKMITDDLFTDKAPLREYGNFYLMSDKIPDKMIEEIKVEEVLKKL